jgi:predicted ATP-grasp superfamily ATP-dependent carboligase
MRVLVTDADHRNALAAVRALGKQGIYVVVAGRRELGPAFFSRYCKKRYFYPNPADEENFVEALIEIIKRERIDVLLPIGATSCVLGSKNKKRLTAIVKMALPDYRTFLKAYDKSKTVRIAEQLGVPCPKTFFPRSFEETEQAAMELGYPLVLKARKGSGYSGVKIVEDRSELRGKYFNLIETNGKNTEVYDHRHPLVQEYIPGEIYDVCIFAYHGKIVRSVTQGRLKTLPVTGGAGVWNVTTDDLGLTEYTGKLAKAIHYHGPAQIEYKLDQTGRPRLMEINPKFWGTLDLSIEAGANFPLLAANAAMGEKLGPDSSFKKGIEYVWLFPYQLVYFFRTKRKLEYILDLRRLFRRNVKTDFYWSDLLPSIVMIYSSFVGLFKRENVSKVFR